MSKVKKPTGKGFFPVGAEGAEGFWEEAWQQPEATKNKPEGKKNWVERAGGDNTPSAANGSPSM